MRYGEVSERFYIILQGRVSVNLPTVSEKAKLLQSLRLTGSMYSDISKMFKTNTEDEEDDY